MISPRGPETIGEPELPAPAADVASLTARAEEAVADGGRLPALSIEGHEWTLFTESTPMIAALVADLRAARRRIWIETYIFADDSAGRTVVELLAQRARAGLDVRVMYDTVGSLLTPSSLFQPLRDAGVKVHAFHTLGEAFWRFRFFQLFNQRNHRKLFVIDDRIGYFGGMNIVDQSQVRSVEDERRRNLPMSAGWRDVHVRMEGPRQRELALAMDELWRYAENRRLTIGRRWPLRQMVRSGEDRFFFFDCRPMFRYRRGQRVFVRLIRRARRNITISMAYFIPFGRVLRELVRARRRGVRIRVIIPAESDVRAVKWATRHFYSRLLKYGIRIYERNDQMLHSKAMVIDDEWSVLGSCNLDPRSLRTNLEFVAVARSRPLAAALLGVCRHEINNSTRVTVDHCRNRNCWQRFLDRLAWSFRRML
ncbi:MAG: phospholipase D-like domain-containing protein [Pirellulales bacterium]